MRTTADRAVRVRALAGDIRDLKQTTMATATATRKSPKKGLTSRTIAAHVHYKSVHFLPVLSLQNSNVK